MTAETPVISVIVPVYNKITYLSECLCSIQSQSYKNWECVCVDDGSTDGSPDIVEQYAQDDARFRLVRQKNAGPGIARNTGLAQATGAYFTFVDADDTIHPQMLECLYNCSVLHNADLVVCSGSQSELDVANMDFNDIIRSAQIFAAPLLPKLIVSEDFRVEIWAKLYKKEDFTDLLFPALYANEDTYVHIDVYAKSNKVALIDIALYHYRQIDGSLFRNGFVTYQRYIAAGLDITIHYLDVCREFGADVQTTYRLARHFGSGAVLLHLFNALSDKSLSKAEKNSCKELARVTLQEICIRNPFGWRVLPIWYWFLYPTFIEYRLPGTLFLVLTARKIAKWILLKKKSIIKRLSKV